MEHGWLTTTIGGRKVEHIPCPNPGALVSEHAPPTGVVHTVEGSLESGLAVFRIHYAPHFLLDGTRTIQLVPLGTMAAALENRLGGVETNSIVRAQIEVAGNSREEAWSFDKRTTEALADLLATLSTVAGIPLVRPFPDALEPPPWATVDFARRRAGKWGKVSGWFGHIEVPENEHWDPGALEWTDLLARSKSIAKPEQKPKTGPPAPAEPPRRIPAWYWHWLSWLLGEGDYRRFGPRSAAHRPADAPKKIPSWGWVKAGQFITARMEPHGT